MGCSHILKRLPTCGFLLSLNLRSYFFFGVLCGFICNVAYIPFPLSLFKKLLDQMPSLEDLKELSPILGKSLPTLLDDEGDDFGEVFHIHFNVPWDKNDVDNS